MIESKNIANKNNELLLKAIDNYSEITNSQKRLLRILVTSNKELSASSIIQITKLKKQWIYLNLKKLSDLKLINKEDKLEHNLFSINQTAKDKILEFFYKNQKKPKVALTKEIFSLQVKISEYLKEKNIPVTTFEKRAGLPSATIARILSAETQNPATQTLIKIANAMGCSLDTLLDRRLEAIELSPSRKKKL